MISAIGPCAPSAARTQASMVATSSRAGISTLTTPGAAPVAAPVAVTARPRVQNAALTATRLSGSRAGSASSTAST